MLVRNAPECPVRRVKALAGLGGKLPKVMVVGCQPWTLDEGIGLSEPVAAAVNPAVEAVHRVLIDLFSTAQKELQP